MATPAAVNMVSDDSGLRHAMDTQPGKTRKYARGQQVKVRLGNGELEDARIVDFGIQELLPLYWVRIDGSQNPVLMFEFELDAGRSRDTSDADGRKRA